MPELLTSHLVSEELKRLLAAFPRNLGSSNPVMMAEVYKNGLRGIDGESFRAAVEVCIQNDNFFPKVSRLREAAAEWRKRNRSAFSPVIQAAWDVCGICGARAEATEKGRTVMNHHAEAHKVHRGESDEYQGVA